VGVAAGVAEDAPKKEDRGQQLEALRTLVSMARRDVADIDMEAFYLAVKDVDTASFIGKTMVEIVKQLATDNIDGYFDTVKVGLILYYTFVCMFGN
jgi:hypothetical protein